MARREFGLIAKTRDAATPVDIVDQRSFKSWRAGLGATTGRWCDASGFKGQAGRILRLPNRAGDIGRIAFGLGRRDKSDLWRLATLRHALPSGVYEIASGLETSEMDLALNGWAIAGYKFDRYKRVPGTTNRRLLLSNMAMAETAIRWADATWLARDLINTPASDLGPMELADQVKAVADGFGAACQVIAGDDLLSEQLPMIHAVGRASDRPPALIDLTWGDPDHPKVTLVGKGVCFDTGGLDLKPAAGMLLMKKDMGGAANTLALAHMIMASEMPIRLRLLIPAVDNNVSANAYRPGDILDTRKGITVEIGNTDAEGRLVLADALALADEENPDLIIDIATLTGAARTALGPELPAMFTGSNAMAHQVARAATEFDDPLWRLPLWDAYETNLSSRVADTNNISSGPFAGCITAALFLRKFVSHADAWIHLDISGWNFTDRPGRPIGGDVMSIRALHQFLTERYSDQ